MKKLAEQRKGDPDNVIPFSQPELATAPKPPGKDWLRSLPYGCRFVCRRNGETGSQLDWYGIAQIEDRAILLGTDHNYNPGHLKFDWFDSALFSAQRTLVQVLPDMKQVEEEQLPEG